ncbi:hypothetical protein MNBD_ACTINO01-897, partial [hydrothermal vent metagenome]
SVESSWQSASCVIFMMRMNQMEGLSSIPEHGHSVPWRLGEAVASYK